MADFCSIPNLGRSKTLTKMSGLPESKVTSFIGYYLDQYERFPELDEIPGANSFKTLEEEIGLKTTDKGTIYTDTDKILEFTRTSSIQEANAILNSSHRDLDIKLYSIGNTTFVNVKHRASEYDNIEPQSGNVNIPDSLELQKIGLISALDKMRDCYGIKINYIHSEDVVGNADVNLAKGFIQNGEIYINLDNATIDSPVHELLHLLIGSFSNTETFYQLVSQVEQFEDFEQRIAKYGNRTLSDLEEELFVEELAKYLTGQPSMFNSISKGALNSIIYNLKRDLDTILDGTYSVKAIDEQELFSMSLTELANAVDSQQFNTTTATTHRLLANLKEELLNKGELQEYCE